MRTDLDIGEFRAREMALINLHRSARERGMSESAIARLPKLPVYADPLPLPPVVLAKAPGTISKRLVGPDVPRVGGRFIRTKPIPPPKPDHLDEVQRGRAAVALIAKAFALEPYQVLETTGLRRFGAARRIATVILHDVIGVRNKMQARIFSLDKFSIIRLRQEGVILLQTRPEIAAIHDQALASIKARWPQYSKDLTP